MPVPAGRIAGLEPSAFGVRGGLRAAALIAACSLLAPPAAQAASARLWVGAQPQQQFQGFGISFEQNNDYPELSPENRALVDRLIFTDLNTRIVRLWYGPGNPEPVRDFYLARGIIPAALAHGVRELLLGPWSYVGDPQEQARLIADDIRTMRDEYGVGITTTGIANEPDGLPRDHYVPLVLAMRKALDAAGLEDVKLLGPEFASADAVAMRWFDAVAAEPTALDAVDALATHSYNMAATSELAERVRRHGKEYWMTEAGGGVEDGSGEFNYKFGTSAAARFLNDLNNAVTHWVWFIGLGEGTEDVLQKLVMCDPTCDRPSRIYKNAAYHYLQQINAAFVPGTVLRDVTSDLAGFEDLVWTYGPKPPLNAAAGVRPDGRWAIGVVNDTLGGDYPHTSWADPEPYTVTIEVAELVSVPVLEFELCRTGPKEAFACGGTALMENGRTTLELQPMELVTLIAR